MRVIIADIDIAQSCPRQGKQIVALPGGSADPPGQG